METIGSCPDFPTSVVNSHFQVNKTVCQRRRHTIGNTLIAFTIAGSNHNYIVGQLVLTDATIQDKLVCTGLNAGRSGIHLVQEQNDNRILTGEFFVRQIDRRRPVHLAVVLVEEGNTTKIGRLHLSQTQVNKCAIHFLCDISDNLALADTRRAPEKHGTLMLEAGHDSPASGLSGNGTAFADGFFGHCKTPCGVKE